MKIKHLLITCATVFVGLVKGQTPVANFSITSPACSGTTLQITDLSTNSPTAWSYTMTGGAPATSTLQNPMVSYFGAGTYSITLICSNGTGTSTPVTKTVSVLPGANFFINPATLSKCANNPASLTFSASSFGGPITYSWSTGVTTASCSVNPSVTTTYSCVGTATNGCKATRTATAVINPVPTLTLFANPTAICPGGTSTLTVLSSGPAPNTYSWSTGATTSVITTSVTGNYNVSVTNSVGCSSNQSITINAASGITMTAVSNPSVLCAGSSATLSSTGASTYTWSTGATTATTVVTPTTTTTYTVNGASGACTGSTTVVLTVNASPTVNATASSPTICTGSSATLSATGATTYTWNPGAMTGANVVVSPTVNTTYTVNGSNGTCIGTRTIAIGVNPGPLVNAVANPSMICSGGTSTITASGALTYTWNTGATTTVIAVSPTVNTTYTVTGTGPSGCTRSRTVTVVVNTPSLNATANPTAVCAGSPSTLTATGAVTYSWSTGATTGVTVVTPTATTIYSVTGTSALGCSLTRTVQVIANPSSTVVATSSSPSVCSGNTVALMATGASGYTWTPGGLTGANVVVSPTANTVYTVTGNNACGINTRTVGITVSAKPTIFVISSASVICVGSSAILTASSTAVTYTWSTGSNSMSISVSPTTTTTYTVNGTNAAGCVGTATITQVVSPCTGIDAASGSVSTINAYPNPTNGEFNITLPTVIANATIEIYNSIGQLVLRSAVKDSYLKLNISNQPNGIYHLRVMQENKQVYKSKIIKE